ncbi:hypothetical protein ACH5RR_000373 [Cinchona calisaya]|uniref:Uncharacterized protein n=1 Tax=Cinchona calisaya TaxID=153742 RepID=A0ABD3B0G8_9GENT
MEIVVGDDEVREESSPSRFQGLGIKRKIRKQRWKTRTQILPLQLPSSQAPKQESNTTPPFHPVFKFLIPSLLAVVAFKYQGSSEDPSKTHPLQTWSFVLAIFIYSLIKSFAIAIKQPQNQSAKFLQFLKLAALASGVVSSLLLVSLLLPRFPGLILLYTSWALFAIISACQYFKRPLVIGFSGEPKLCLMFLWSFQETCLLDGTLFIDHLHKKWRHHRCNSLLRLDLVVSGMTPDQVDAESFNTTIDTVTRAMLPFHMYWTSFWLTLFSTLCVSHTITLFDLAFIRKMKSSYNMF